LIWWWTRKRIIGNKWRAEEEERHKGVTDKKNKRKPAQPFCGHGRCDLKQQTWNRNISHIRQNLIHNSAII
jgi:hypothetical protein